MDYSFLVFLFFLLFSVTTNSRLRSPICTFSLVAFLAFEDEGMFRGGYYYVSRPTLADAREEAT
jgi:hypothetical protein